MRRPIASAAIAVAAVLSAPAAAHAAEPGLQAEPALQEVSLPFLWQRAELHDVDADGPDDVWAAGVQGVFCLPYYEQCVIDLEGNPVVRRWTGTSWTEYPLNGWTGNGPIEQVTSAEGETWIAGVHHTGDGGGHYLARFDGAAFQEVATPSDRLETISAGAAGTWLVEYGTGTGARHRLFERTGSAWTGVELPAEVHTITDVRARTATDAWLVGAGPSTPGVPGRLPAVAHFDGTSWTSVPPPELPELPIGAEDGGFVKVVPVGPDDVWAITTRFLTHWDGDRWTVVRIPEAGWEGRDLAVDAWGVPWVVAPWALGSSDLYQYVDGAWQNVTTPAVGLNGIAAVPGTSTIWGAGVKGGDAAAVRTP